MFFVSCKRKLDATNLTTLKNSIEDVRNSLNESEKEEFDNALSNITDELNLVQLIAFGIGGNKITSVIRDDLHKKTAQEII